MNQVQPHPVRQSTGISLSKVRWLIQHSHWLALALGFPVAVAAFLAPASIPYFAVHGVVGIIMFLVLASAWRLRSLALHIVGSLFLGLSFLTNIDHAFPAEPRLSFWVAPAVPFFVMFLLCAVLRSTILRFARIPDEQSA